MEELKLNDVVEFVSGGHKMTVIDLNPKEHEGEIKCKWSTGKDYKTDFFSPGSLKKIATDGSSNGINVALVRETMEAAMSDPAKLKKMIEVAEFLRKPSASPNTPTPGPPVT